MFSIIPKEIIKFKEIIKYVPLYPDDRSYEKKWEDKDYLQTLSTLNTNKIFMSEALNALRTLRDQADKATSPEELKGCNAGINVIKKLLCVSEAAKVQLVQIREAENLKEMEKSNVDGSASG